MKIKYKLKPEDQRPVVVGMLCRIKKDWYDKLDEIGMNLMEIGTGLGKLTGIGTVSLFEEGFTLCSYSELIICDFENSKGTWTVPIDCLERRPTKASKKIVPIQKKSVPKTIGKVMPKSIFQPKGRIKH